MAVRYHPVRRRRAPRHGVTRHPPARGRRPDAVAGSLPSDQAAGAGDRARRALPLGLLLLVPLVLVALWAATRLGAAYPPIALPTAGPCPATPRPVHLVLMLDDSGSTADTDPATRRYPEATQVIDWMARSRCGSDESVSVVHFGATAGATGPVALGGDLDPVRGALAGPNPTVGIDATRLGPAVGALRALIASSPAGQTIAVVMSDGQVEDPWELRSLVGTGATIDVVALGGPLPDEWASAGITDVVALDASSPVGSIGTEIAIRWLDATRTAP